jgi:hypothetical protein
MNFDFRLFRRTAPGICGIALVGFLLGGCVSFHKPRFWDKDDVKTTDTTGAQPTAPPTAVAAPAASPAPTVVAADHSATDDSSGHVAAFDFADPTPSNSSGQTTATAASGLQPTSDSKPAVAGSDDGLFAPIVPRKAATDEFAVTPPSVPAATQGALQSKGNDPFAEAAAPPVVVAAPTTPPAVKEATPPAVVSSSKTPPSADPFADADSAAFAAAAPPQPVTKPAPQPVPVTASTSPQPAAPRQAVASTQPSAALPQPASAEPAWSPEPVPVTAAQSPQSVAPPTHAPATPVASVNHSNEGVDAFADPKPPAAPKAPVAPLAVDAVENTPSCAAPESKKPLPCATAAATPETSAESSPSKTATSGAWVPVRAPAATEQVTATETRASATNAAQVQVVIPSVKTPAARKISPAPSVAKAPAHEEEAVTRPDAKPSQTNAQSADAPAANSMICDSKSVRGRFTGIGHSTGEAAHDSTPKAIPSKPSTQRVPTSDTDADRTPSAHEGQDAKAAGQTAVGPKPLSAVVNAVAHQIGQVPVADPFALEQTVDSSATDPISVGEAPAQLKSDAPRPFHAEEASAAPISTELLAAAPSLAPQVPRERTRIHPDMWFAIGIGVGLAASFALWVRMRPKREHLLNG